MSLTHDLYARAWECEYEKPNFDAEENNATPPNSPKNPVQSDALTEEARNNPETAHECSPYFPQTEQVCDVTDTYLYTAPDVEASSEYPINSPTNLRSSKYNLHHVLRPNAVKITDIRS